MNSKVNNDENSIINPKKSRFFKLLFQFCFILTILCIIYYAYSLYQNNKKETLSKKLVDDFTITKLYSNSTNYTAQTINTYQEEGNSFSVIGLIEINRINISYPILSEFNEDLLKIAPCKFYGSNPNEIGNLCIAGHNYNNYKFFSKLKNLNQGDLITIYDLSGAKVSYEIYSTYETDWQDFSCTSQDTNGKKEITLITCNNIKNRRRVVKAIEKG